MILRKSTVIRGFNASKSIRATLLTSTKKIPTAQRRNEKEAGGGQTERGQRLPHRRVLFAD